MLDRQNTAEFGEALEFIEKVKLRCDPDMYGQFMEIIKWDYITRTTLLLTILSASTWYVQVALKWHFAHETLANGLEGVYSLIQGFP